MEATQLKEVKFSYHTGHNSRYMGGVVHLFSGFPIHYYNTNDSIWGIL